SMTMGSGASLTPSGGTITANGLAAGTYGNAVTLNNAVNSFAGNGAGLTSLAPGNISAGTAGINITGNAATATNATNAANATGPTASTTTLGLVKVDN